MHVRPLVLAALLALGSGPLRADGAPSTAVESLDVYPGGPCSGSGGGIEMWARNRNLGRPVVARIAHRDGAEPEELWLEPGERTRLGCTRAEDGTAQRFTVVDAEFRAARERRPETPEIELYLRAEIRGRCGFANSGDRTFIVNRHTSRTVVAPVEIRSWRTGGLQNMEQTIYVLPPGGEQELGCTAGSSVQGSGRSFRVDRPYFQDERPDEVPQQWAELTHGEICTDDGSGRIVTLVNHHPKMALVATVDVQTWSAGDLVDSTIDDHRVRPGQSVELGCSVDPDRPDRSLSFLTTDLRFVRDTPGGAEDS